MDYCKKTNNKPGNLITIHDRHEKFFQDSMKWLEAKEKLTKEDCRLWFKRYKKDEEWVVDYSVSISGSVLQQCGGNLFFWRRLQIMSSKYNRVEIEYILKYYLYKFNLRYFVDEDGCGGIFRGKTSDEKQSFIYCYISPDFPEGYFENHSLETKPNKPW